jgi:hypothetical protein
MRQLLLGLALPVQMGMNGEWEGSKRTHTPTGCRHTWNRAVRDAGEASLRHPPTQPTLEEFLQTAPCLHPVVSEITNEWR